jgi:hypothetical protein
MIAVDPRDRLSRLVLTRRSEMLLAMDIVSAHGIEAPKNDKILPMQSLDYWKRRSPGVETAWRDPALMLGAPSRAQALRSTRMGIPRDQRSLIHRIAGDRSAE